MMDISTAILQVLMSTIGSFGFSILYHIRGRKLLLAALGGGLSWAIYLALAPVLPDEPIRYFICACFVAFYAEILARILKTPATTFLIPSMIPHIPGGSLYHTMRYALNREWGACLSQAVYTLSLALGLALGIIAVLSVFGVIIVVMNKLWYRMYQRSIKKEHTP